MGVQPPDGPLEDSSDLAELWNEALDDFKTKTKLDLTKFHYKSMEEAIASTKQQEEQFSAFRHDKGKVDAVRTAFGNNLKLIQKIVTGAKMAADAASVFPPAIPGTMLMTAFTYVFQTFKDVKADYDRVAGFFTEMGSFLDRISMLEEKSPKLGPFERCVRKVFASMLTLCGIAADYKSKGRFRKWLHNIKDGSGDPALAGAYDAMEDAIRKLGEAVGVATLRTAIEIKETTTKLDHKTDDILSSQQEIKEISSETREGITVIREGVEHIDMRMDGIQTSITTVDASVMHMESKMDTQQAIIVSKLDALLKQSATEMNQEANLKEQSRSKGDPTTRKHRALAQVRRHFADGAEVRKKIKAQRQDIEDSFAKGTATWIFEDDAYKAWADGDQSVLWLSGSAGTGKTYIAHAITSRLESRRDEHTSVAHFFFREDSNDLRSFRNALRCAVLQIAEKNDAYSGTVAAEISKQNAQEEPWKQFFAARFPAKSVSHLYLVLDGIDEAHDDDRAIIAELFNQIPKEQLNIHVLFTGRPELRSLFGDSAPVTVEVSKERIAGDMRMVIETRTRSLPRIRQFRKQTRKRIESLLMLNADCMLYVEHMLRRLSAIGRESAVLKDIEKGMPNSLEALYHLMLSECQKSRTPKQYETLRTLFAMLAFSKRQLTLDEASDLVKLTDPDGTFDIEDEVIGRSARILDLGGDREDDDENDEEQNAQEDDHGSDGSPADVLVESGKTPLTFQERSLREYFRAINIEEHGLRTPAAHAHLIITELLVNLLCDESNANSGKNPRLQNYAACFWEHHFVEISPDDQSDERVVRVLSCLRRIVINANNVANALETQHAPYHDALEKETSFLTILPAWTQRARTLKEPPADLAMKEWLDDFMDSPTKILLALARGHIESWFKTSLAPDAHTAFLFAKTALTTAKAIDVSSVQEKRGDVLAVLDFFPDIPRDAAAYRVIAYVMQRRNHHEESIEFARKSLEADRPDGPNRFRAHWSVAYALWMIGASLNAEAADDDGPTAEDDSKEVEKQQDRPGRTKFEEAWQETAIAMTVLPSDWKSDVKVTEAVEHILLLRALCEQNLGRPDDAIKTYAEHRNIRPDVNTMRGADLYNMTRVRDWEKNPSGYFELIESWTPKERLKWLEYLFTSDYFQDATALDDLHKYAKLAGESAQKLVIDWYEGYIKSFRRGSAKSIPPRNDLALFYRNIMKNRKRAIEINSEILSAEIKYDEYDNLELHLLDIRLELCHLLFTEFRATTDPKEKLALLERAKKLSNPRTTADSDVAQESEEAYDESQTAVMLALMTRTIGSPIDFQDMMQKSFKTCIEGLTDSVGYNDSDSFRLLAKVLACVPGLGRDAQIAISCQFSITDPNVEHGADASSESGASEVNEKPDVKSDELLGNQEEKAPEVVEKTTVIEIEKVPISDGTAEVTTKIQELTTSEENDDGLGDLLPEHEWNLWCDGCGREFNNWTTGTVYFCIQCANCDLCESCWQVSFCQYPSLFVYVR